MSKPAGNDLTGENAFSVLPEIKKEKLKSDRLESMTGRTENAFSPVRSFPAGLDRAALFHAVSNTVFNLLFSIHEEQLRLILSLADTKAEVTIPKSSSSFWSGILRLI